MAIGAPPPGVADPNIVGDFKRRRRCVGGRRAPPRLKTRALGGRGVQSCASLLGREPRDEDVVAALTDEDSPAVIRRGGLLANGEDLTQGVGGDVVHVPMT